MNIVERIKGDLLSVSAVIVTILHIFMIVGGVVCCAMFRSHFVTDQPIKLFCKM